MSKNYKFETLQLHVGQENPDPATDSRAVPIYATTSYVFHDSAHAAARFGLADAGNIYGRLTNSTQDVFEKRIAALEGGIAALAVASGAAAISYTLQALAQAGDHIVAQKTIYGGTYNLIAHTLSQFGVSTSFVNAHNLEELESAIKPETKAVYIETLGNPNSDIPDIDKIAEIAHKHGLPLVVDNTFGTPYFIRPIEHGADIVIHSLHKTLPALTQTAAAHLCTERISPVAFQRKLSVFETSSPSYLLLSSIAECVRFLEEKAETAFTTYEKELEYFSNQCKTLTHITVLCKGNDTLKLHPAFFAFDGGKLPIITANTNTDGVSFLQKLRTEYKIEGEMAAVSYALLMTSVCETENGFARLFAALQGMDCTLQSATVPPQFTPVPLPPVVFSPDEAAKQTGARMPLQNAVGKTSLNTVWCYPPGVPLLVRGERVTKEIADALENAKAHRLKVIADGGEFPKITVCD